MRETTYTYEEFFKFLEEQSGSIIIWYTTDDIHVEVNSVKILDGDIIVGDFNEPYILKPNTSELIEWVESEKVFILKTISEEIFKFKMFLEVQDIF